jgi:predicted permease
MNFALRLYRALARAFPHEFQMAYGADVIQLGEDIVEDVAKQNGFFGLFRLIADLAIRIPIEYLTELRQDLIYAVRTLRKARGFAAVGILSLGLGIGMSAVAVSEALDMILSDAPGVREPDRVIMVNNVSYPYIERYGDQHDLFAGAAAFQMAVPYNVSVGEGASAKAERIFGQLVSPEYFSVLGVSAARGRVFAPDRDRPGSAPIVVISDRFWRERLNSDPSAVGRTLRVNGQTATIAGIGPKDFLGAIPFVPADIFVPTTAPEAIAPELAGDAIHQRDAKTFNALLRLAPGVTVESAEAGLDTVTRRLDEETLDPARNAKGLRVMVLPGGKVVPVPRSMLPLVLGFMALLNGLLLSLVCMNLANMQLARATARRREIAIRLSVGASRFRLMRQLLVESVLLSVTGAAAGIALAFWAAAAVERMRLPFPFPVRFDITPDWRAMLVVFAIAVMAGVGFGLAPALAATRTDLASTLKEGLVGQTRGARRFGMRNLLMVGQVAGSLALLLITGFLVTGFHKTNDIVLGFDPSAMYLLSLDPVRDGYAADKAAMLFDDLGERLQRVPGVRNVALALKPPCGPESGVLTLSAPGAGGAPDRIVSGVAKETVGPRYFAALSAPVLDGREFDIRERHIEPSKSRALPVVINQTAAHEFFGAAEPVGRRLSETSNSYEVIGVVKDLPAPMSDRGALEEVSSIPVIYMPMTKNDFQHSTADGIVVMVRSDHGGEVMQGVRRELAALDPNVAIFRVHTLAGQIDDTLANVRMGEFVYGGIGTFGMVLAAIGLAGVTAYSVARRRKEIGIRMALGAGKGQVLRLVLREGGTLVIVGSVLGFLGAVALSRVFSAMSSMFAPAFRAGMSDPRLLLGAPLLLAALAMLACYIPARRSAAIDPLRALREE